MHVKDYLQALSDDKKIRVEKIGSGNWYWSFPSDEKKAKDAVLAKAKEEHSRTTVTVLELQSKVGDAGAARAEDEDMLMELGNSVGLSRQLLLKQPGGDRKTLIIKYAEFTKELEKLRGELATYSEQDPVEMEKKATEMQQSRCNAEKYSDQILSMEGWFKEQLGGGDREHMLSMLRMLYNDEFDEEERGLREL